MEVISKEKPFTLTRLKFLSIGNKLLTLFFVTVMLLGAGLIALIIKDGFKEVFSEHWILLIVLTFIECVIFWIGIILVYVTSVQLGVKLRLIGLICGLIPIVHLVVLLIIIKTTSKEVKFERAKIKVNEKRASEQICKTKYPILMVHGVFFRDFRYFNYWGRIPAELEKNGAIIHYGNHQSAASVMDSAKELTERVKEIVEKTGCEKVNIIAHSKGGLDSKTAVALLGLDPYVASITSINTPHQGCEFAEYLLNKAPDGLKDRVSSGYNSTFRRLGDPNPDFIAAVTDLTASKCKENWETTSAFDFKAAGIYTQSVGSCMKKAASGAFPLNLSYRLVGHFDGLNDGLVGEPSFHWGEDYTFLENKKKRGISHGDMIDLNRENIDGFDVREFYVQLVADLKKKGL